MKNLTGLDWTAMALLIAGGINWGLIGFFNFDLIAALFGPLTGISRFIYAIVGLSALYMAFDAFQLGHKTSSDYHHTTHPSRA